MLPLRHPPPRASVMSLTGRARMEVWQGDFPVKRQPRMVRRDGSLEAGPMGPLVTTIQAV